MNLVDPFFIFYFCYTSLLLYLKIRNTIANNRISVEKRPELSQEPAMRKIHIREFIKSAYVDKAWTVKVSKKKKKPVKKDEEDEEPVEKEKAR